MADKEELDKRLQGWKRLQDGSIQFYNYAGGAVFPTEHHVAMAIRYVTSQAQLDAVRNGQTQPEQLQLGLNSQQCRYLAEQLLRGAEFLEKQAPPPDKRN